MANEPNQFAALMERVIQGDEQAVAELYNRYYKAIIMVVRYRLDRSPRLHALYDSTDFLQEVWEDVLAHPEKLRDLATFEAFFEQLARMARHKVEKTQRKYATQKRDLRRRRHLSDPGVTAAAAAVADSQPDPGQQAASDEEWGRWIVSLSPRQQRIVLMLRNGLTHEEIAAELGCSERSIRRLVSELRYLPSPVPLSDL